MNANIFAKAGKIAAECGSAYFGVTDEDGCPSVSTVTPLKTDGIFRVYFSAGLCGNKIKRLRRDKRASVCFQHELNNITLVGEAQILTDFETKKNFWTGWLTEHFPEGENDPNYCIVMFESKRASLWVGDESAEFLIKDLLTVQSYCGLLCKWCGYRESNGCGGCAETKGVPFHGECPVAKCCIGKGFSHCGECENLPGECASPDCKRIDANGFYECGGCKETSCGKLYPYSYRDPDNGDNPPGARVEMCKAWKDAGFMCADK